MEIIHEGVRFDAEVPPGVEPEDFCLTAGSLYMMRDGGLARQRLPTPGVVGGVPWQPRLDRLCRKELLQGDAVLEVRLVGQHVLERWVRKA